MHAPKEQRGGGGARETVPTDVTDAPSTKSETVRGLPDLASQDAALAPGGEAETTSAGGGDPATDGSAWARVVCRNFPSWDANGDGRITVQEANDRVAQKKDQGEDYAALRGLLFYMEQLAALSKDGDPARGKHLGVTEKDLDVYAQSYPRPNGDALATLDEGFANVTKKLGAEKDYGLYGKSGVPDPKLLHQGMIGTCYFLAPLIALAERDPNAICQMIVEHPAKDGGLPSYTVTFPGQKPVTVTLGDDEMRVMQTSAGDSGVWAAVMERAFIAHNWEQMKADKDKKELKKGEVGAAEGGFGKDTIELLTGNGAKQIAVKSKSLKKLDELLTAASEKGALMTCGINLQWWKKASKKPLPDQHEYALLCYQDGKVTVRNPHGAGAGGELMNGDGSAVDGLDDGEFTVDLATFREMFSNLTIEQK